MVSKQVFYDGSEAEPGPRIDLKAGPLSMVFEPDLGFLRYIRLGDREVLRGIYSAVRDQNWDTIAPQIDNLKVEQGADSFDLTFDVTCQEREIDFFWRGQITGDADGKVVFSMDGEARSAFRRNRIGFCVLHSPAACAGDSCSVEKSDGSVEEGRFPDAISAHQPLMDMRAITHEVIPGVKARIGFEGDVFEMEDQRNWTDASYKTYCTPLVLPFPVALEAGTKVAQSVTISLEGDVPEASEEVSALTFTSSGEPSIPLPEIGLGMASHGGELNERQLKRLHTMHLSHLRMDLHLSRAGWEETLERAVRESKALDVKLEGALFFSDQAEAELKALAEALEAHRPPMVRWLVFHEKEMGTTEKWVALAKPVLKEYDAEAQVGAGTNAYFTELNRERAPVALLDTVAYSVNPQVHAFDNASLVETLVAQGWTVDSARTFVGDLPISVTPVTLRARFNPNATGPESEPAPGTLPPSVDVRQISLLGAGWTVGSLKYLSEACVQSITYYETTGWRGVMEVEEGCAAPEQFRSVPDGAFPLYHVLVDFGGMFGGEIVPSKSSDSLLVDGLILKKGPWVRMLIANLTAEAREVTVQYPGLQGFVRVEVLDETNVEMAMSEPERFRGRRTSEHGIDTEDVLDDGVRLTLNPYAVVCVKGVVDGG